MCSSFMCVCVSLSFHCLMLCNNSIEYKREQHTHILKYKNMPSLVNNYYDFYKYNTFGLFIFNFSEQEKIPIKTFFLLLQRNRIGKKEKIFFFLFICVSRSTFTRLSSSFSLSYFLFFVSVVVTKFAINLIVEKNQFTLIIVYSVSLSLSPLLT